MRASDLNEVVFLDFEFIAMEGERARPVCCVARELRSGRLVRHWFDGLSVVPSKPNFAIDRDTLVVGYFISGDLICFRALGWPDPARVCDLFAEFRTLTNGKPVPCGTGLLGALSFFGLDAMAGLEKDTLRARILRGGPFSDEDRTKILDYCMKDVNALLELFPRLISPEMELGPIMLRGEFMKAIANAEFTGVPIDAELYRMMKENWLDLQDSIISKVNTRIPVFAGRHLKQNLLRDWLELHGLLKGWPVTPRSGRLASDDETLRRKAAHHPILEPLRQGRQVLGQMRELKLSVGSDGRNRCLLSPYSTKTSRCAPSSTRFIFSAPSFLRGLIKPEPGRALVLADWTAQEFGVAAALSKEPAMLKAYESGDVYLAFAKLAGAVPPDATKESHPREREIFKAVVLSVQYGITAPGLAVRLECALCEAEALLEHHHHIFPRFWDWSESACDCAQLEGKLESTFGWRLHFSEGTTLRTVRNFPIQANAAEMLRLACIDVTRAGLSLNAPIHDALMVEAAESEIEQVANRVQEIMRHASEIILSGFPLSTDVIIVRPPGRYRVKRGEMMWDWIMESLGQLA